MNALLHVVPESGTDDTVVIQTEKAHHASDVDMLVHARFGQDRFKKTVYRLRENTAPLGDLSLVAMRRGQLVGTLRFWPIRIGAQTPALLLGPLAVASAYQGLGIATRLMHRGLARAQDHGHEIVVLVGDEPYYRRFGFRRDLARDLALPGPVALERFLARELTPDALLDVGGMIEAPRDATVAPPFLISENGVHNGQDWFGV